MSLGIRANLEMAVASGFRASQFCQPAPDELDAVRAYLRSLEPERSPFLLPDGEMSEKSKRGKVIFESPRTHCAACHPAPLFTDLRLHNVGTHRAPELPSDFDTPALVEVWRTAPYLHHGDAVTLKDVLTSFNPQQLHGKTAHLTAEEIDALVEYLLSL